MKRLVGRYSGESIQGLSEKPLLHTSHDLSVQALQKLLQNPIRFVLATDTTLEDESRITPTLSPDNDVPRRVDQDQAENVSQRQHSFATDYYFSRWQRQASSPAPSRGLYNRRNDCYRNSILQALLHVPNFVYWLELRHENCNSHPCAACTLKALCIRYWDQSQKEISHEMRSLVGCLRGTDTFRPSRWNWQEQHDASEFYSHLVDSLTDTNRRILSTVRRLLGHTLAVTVTCPLCKETDRWTDRQPIEYTLNVNFQQGAPLEDLLRTTNFGPNIAPGRRCDHCGKKADTSRRMRIWNSPYILVISINRFRLERGRYVKNLDKVTFREVLDLTPFTENNTILKYRLTSVVHHLGSRNQGHYKAVAKSPGGIWEELEDEVVKKVRVDAALKPSHPWTPYMLFYARTEVNEPVQNSPSTIASHSATDGQLRTDAHSEQRGAKGHGRTSQSTRIRQNRVHKYGGSRRRNR